MLLFNILTFVSFFIIMGVAILAYTQLRKNWIEPDTEFPISWRMILLKDVTFYNSLTTQEREWFEYKVHEFLLNYKITGIHTEVNARDKVLIAASGIIPIFKFRDWRYKNLQEILVYPDMFDEDFKTEGKGRRILGMVGTGYMKDKMILSQQALRFGFDNAKDKRNTAIHEFIHLIDMMDGDIDGIPKLILERPYVLPWLELMKRKMDEIYDDDSDINPYGGKNKIEFFAVVSEYFFERPRLLEKRHPDLYKMLYEIFDHDLSERKLTKTRRIGRNSPCPCHSGEKYKNCCGKM